MTQQEHEVALVGTGIAPLIAAQILMRRGWKVVVLNPERDFFVENSELPFDPVIAGSPRSKEAMMELELQRVDRCREVLGPEFPGSIESWPRSSAKSGRDEEFLDREAPFLRARQWTWVALADEDESFLEFSERGWHPQLAEGIGAARRFPGFTLRGEPPASLSSVSLPKMGDVDVDRYRNGVLEFVRSRLDAGSMVTAAASIEPLVDGVRFYRDGVPQTLRLKHGVWVFRTPRLNSWLASVGVEQEVPTRTWEEWTLVSRDPVDPSQLGCVGAVAAFARTEGLPSDVIHELVVLTPVAEKAKPAGSESFERLGTMVQKFLNWDRFSVRDLKTRSLGGVHAVGSLPSGSKRLRWMSGADGSLAGIVQRVQAFCAEVPE